MLVDGVLGWDCVSLEFRFVLCILGVKDCRACSAKHRFLAVLCTTSLEKNSAATLAPKVCYEKNTALWGCVRRERFVILWSRKHAFNRNTCRTCRLVTTGVAINVFLMMYQT